MCTLEIKPVLHTRYTFYVHERIICRWKICISVGSEAGSGSCFFLRGSDPDPGCFTKFGSGFSYQSGSDPVFVWVRSGSDFFNPDYLGLNKRCNLIGDCDDNGDEVNF